MILDISYAKIAYAVFLSSGYLLASRAFGVGSKYTTWQRFVGGLWLSFLLLSLPLFDGKTALFYLQGLLGEPAVLSVLLSLQIALPTAYQLRPSAKTWLAFGSLIIIASALSLGFFNYYPLNFYHQWQKASDIYIHALVFILVFLPAFLYDKKTLWLMWLCLLAYLANLMHSPMWLDYVADIWLFFYAGVCLIKRCHTIIKKYTKKPHAK